MVEEMKDSADEVLFRLLSGIFLVFFAIGVWFNVRLIARFGVDSRETQKELCVALDHESYQTDCLTLDLDTRSVGLAGWLEEFFHCSQYTCPVKLLLTLTT
jgi:hypothetical protein